MSKLVPTVKIELDKERNLLMDLNAMIAFEEATGKDILAGDAWKSMTAKDIRALLWACLAHEDEKLTLQQVGKLIHAGNMAEVTAKLTETWGNAMPEPDPDGEQPPLTESRSAG